MASIWRLRGLRKLTVSPKIDRPFLAIREARSRNPSLSSGGSRHESVWLARSRCSSTVTRHCGAHGTVRVGIRSSDPCFGDSYRGWGYRGSGILRSRGPFAPPSTRISETPRGSDATNVGPSTRPIPGASLGLDPPSPDGRHSPGDCSSDPDVDRPRVTCGWRTPPTEPHWPPVGDELIADPKGQVEILESLKPLRSPFVATSVSAVDCLTIASPHFAEDG